MRWILLPNDDTRTQEMGGKARALAELSRAGLPVPEWFVVRSGACLDSLSEAGQKELGSTTDSSAIQRLLAKVGPGSGIVKEMEAAMVRLCSATGFVAVRSSASDEDGTEHSFAGQLESFLFVSPDRVGEKVAAVWRSGFSERILAYRQQHRLRLAPKPPAVLVQRMINAEAAGVVFSADPVSGQRGVAVVSAVFGLGTALVSGEANADTWRVDRAGKIIETCIAEKNVAHRSAPDSAEGVRAEALPETRARQPVLTEEQVREVAALARRCAAYFGRPQDIEWALEGGTVYLLQSRPITSLAGMADPDGGLNIWDNSNIAESYGGITTPLTYSFARRAYEEVYRQFCRLMAVPQGRIEANGQVFRCMIGLVRGRVYYNLLNWYRMLAMLPGFTVNRRFMEQMMGVKEGLPEELVSGIQKASATDRLKDGLNLAGTLAGLAVNHFTLGSRIRKFYDRLNRALRSPSPPLNQMRPDELGAYYRELERRLLTRWDAPLVNDFFAMIFFGVLRKLTGKWCGDADGTLPNNLLCGEGGIISAEPARRVLEMAEVAARHPELVAKLCDVAPGVCCPNADTGRAGTPCAPRAPEEGQERPILTPLDGAQRSARPTGGRSESLGNTPVSEVLIEIDRVPEFATLWREYVEKFGDRCLEELKLESATVEDDPTMLLRSVGNLARVRMEAKTGADLKARTEARKGEGAESQLRREAEAMAAAALRGHWLRRVIFGWVLKHTRARVQNRENLRFERTRLFGRVRRIFVALGRELQARNRLDTPADIFYLEMEEALGYCDGTATTADLKGLVALRREEFRRYAAMEPPPDRFETRGPVQDANPRQQAAGPSPEAGPGAQWKGIGCCPGVVRGPVRVVRDPREAALLPGEILVAERTDPGWVVLFASASGLLVERGSLLSHSAIVSREMGLPAIVSLPAITRQLADGDWVELDGSTGIVKRIPHGN